MNIYDILCDPVDVNVILHAVSMADQHYDAYFAQGKSVVTVKDVSTPLWIPWGATASAALIS